MPVPSLPPLPPASVVETAPARPHTDARGLYCTLAQACARLGVSRDLITTWERQGLVQCVRDDRGHRHVRVTDLDTLAEGRPGPLLAPAQAALVVGVQAQTLTGMVLNGLVRCVVLPTGQRRYCPDDLQQLAARRPTTRTPRPHTIRLSAATVHALTRPLSDPSPAHPDLGPTRKTAS